MTIKEMMNLKKGDKVMHINARKIEVIDSEYEQMPNRNYKGFFIREENSKGGWDCLSENTCKYYEKIEKR